MLRKVVGPTACCLLLAWAVVAAPRKDDPPPVYYQPATVGDQLVYERDYGAQSWELVLEVTDVRHEGAALIVTLREVEGDLAPESYRFDVSAKGVYSVGEGDAALGSPVCFLRLPFKKGETWEAAHKLDGETYPTKYTAAGEEEVEVPAGKFRCLRIESEYVFKGATCTRTCWMAPRCGMVKKVDAGMGYVGTTVLKSFTPGGK